MRKHIALIFLLMISPVEAQDIQVCWTNSIKNVDGSSATGVFENILYWGRNSGAYPNSLNAGDTHAAGVRDCHFVNVECGSWFFAVTAKHIVDGHVSGFSNEDLKGALCPTGPPMPPILEDDSPVRSFPFAQFDGTIESAMVHTDQADLARESGRWEVLFTANMIDDAGLVSRDASGQAEAGHAGVGITSDGRVTARMQTVSDGASLRSLPGIIEAGFEYQAVLSFGDKGMRLVLDGVVVDQDNEWISGTTGNDEPLVIGAYTSISETDSADPKSAPFDGSIQMDIYQSQWEMN